MKRTKVLIILECGGVRASGAVRGEQFMDLFRSDPDYEVRYVSQQSPGLAKLRDFFHWHRPLRPLNRIVNRLINPIKVLRERRIIRLARDFELIYVLKVPSLPLFRGLASIPGIRILFDLNDGLWLPHHQDEGWKDLEPILALCHGIVCENRYVSEWAKSRCPSIFLVPDSPQFHLFEAKREIPRKNPQEIVIGWIGSANSCDTLFLILNALEAVFRKHSNIHLRLVGPEPSKLPRFENVRFSYRASYNQKEMVQEVLGMDIGLFPLYDLEDSRVRGTLKTMIYMAGGAIPIAQKVGENDGLVRHGENGFLVNNDSEWISALERLIASPELRESMKANAIDTIRRRHTIDHSFQALKSAFAGLMDTEPNAV